MGNDTATRTGIRVRIAPDREIPISGPAAMMLKAMSVERTNDILTHINTAWEMLDIHLLAGGGEIDEKTREEIGGIFWLLGEAREQLSDFLFLTEDARGLTGGNYGARVASDPAAHEFAGAGR